MDALSSSFISAIPKQKIDHVYLCSSTRSHNFPLYISSVRIEDKAQRASPSHSKFNSKSVSSSTTVTTPPPTTTTTTSTIDSTTSKTISLAQQPSSSSVLLVQKEEEEKDKEKKLPPAAVTLLNAFEDVINTFINPPTEPSIDPRSFLSNNFAPLCRELPPTECRVITGRIPPCLDGAYIRNGPNPQFLPKGPYHLFDGDGMLHCLRISNGGTRVTLSSRYVQTNKFTTEREAGAAVVPNVFSGFNGLPALAARGALVAARVLAGQFNPLDGAGLANTSLALIGGRRLYALGESDLPYEVRVTRDGDVVTVGREDFGGKLSMSMTAHPKVDPETGEVFAFKYGPIPPFLTLFRFDREGNKLDDDVPIFSLRRPSMMHDFSVTKKYAVFSDMQIGMEPAELILRGGPPVGADPGKVPRVGVIPRYAKDEREMRWFDVPGFNIFHSINAWDEVDEQGNESVVMVAPNILSVEHVLTRVDLIHASVEKVKIQLKTGVVSRTPLSSTNLDFGVINPTYLGKKTRFAYAGVGDPMPKISGVVKLDLQLHNSRSRGGDCVVARRMYGEGCFGGEPFFVARDVHPADPNPNNNNKNNKKKTPPAEDDGYLVSYVHDEIKGDSRFLVMDAKSPDLAVVAEVALPQRVPYGFHGLFIRENHLH